jgi:hypothetical protein
MATLRGAMKGMTKRADGTGAPSGLRLMPAYTPAMRRWVCIVALLAGFSADGYAWSARPRHPVPIERRLDIRPPGLVPTPAWWGRS